MTTNIVKEGRPSFAWAPWIALAGMLVLGTGCQNVKPWQRGVLSERHMRSDRDPLGVAMSEHMFFSREAAAGGRGVGGGGCGCN